ncbi:MAG: hypothetical protein QOE41_4602 [Mycobacterium sp.]|jgi:hemophore-related protein|nr:putative antigen [Mycobacterium sp.]MDT5135291.1 hypothetical protein [Mycobacterium sp.]
MVKSLSTKLAVAFGGLALSLTAGAGVASATPDPGPFINTTCSYSQFVAALNVASPDVGQQLSSTPPVQSMLQEFLASPADQRRQMVDEYQSTPLGQEYSGPILQASNTCNHY